MPTVPEILRSKYDFDGSYCGNGLGMRAMQGRLISVVDLTMQVVKGGVGNAMAPIFAVGYPVLDIISSLFIIASDLLTCNFNVVWENLKKMPGNLCKYAFVIVLTVTVGVLANTLLRIITIVGNALGILFPEIGQRAREMDIDITEFSADGNAPMTDYGSSYLIYLFPRPWVMIHSAVIEKIV